MADPLYAFTVIDHGVLGPDGTNKVVRYEPGEQIDTKLFSVDELKNLVAAGAVSKFNRTLLETPEITVEEIEDSTPPPKP
jgi:hypothetical protein